MSQAYADRIVLHSEHIQRLEVRCGEVASSLHQLRYVGNAFDRAPVIAAEMERFEGRWNDTRSEITDGLYRLNDAFRVIRQSFEEMDANLRASLEEGASK